MRRTGLLQWKAYRTLEAFHNPILARYRTTHTEWKLLELLYDEGELRVTEIAGKLGVRTPLITRTLKTLLYKKNIIIGNHSRDKRVKCVDTTAKGEKKLAQIEGDIQKMLKRILRGIPSKKIEIYKEVLTVILRNGKSLGKKPS